MKSKHDSKFREILEQKSFRRRLDNILLASASDLSIIQNNRWWSTRYPGTISINRKGGFLYSGKHVDFYFNQNSPTTNPLFTSAGVNCLQEILSGVGKILKYGNESVDITQSPLRESDFMGWRYIPPIPVLCYVSDIQNRSGIENSTKFAAKELVVKIAKLIF